MQSTEQRRVKLRDRTEAFVAGLVIFGPLAPIAMAMGLAGWSLVAPESGAALLLVIIAAVWLVGGAFAAPQCSPARANPRVYQSLLSLIAGLENALRRLECEPGSPVHSRFVVPLEEELNGVRQALGLPPVGAYRAPPAGKYSRLDWQVGTIYTELFRRLHGVEADLLLLASRAEILDGALNTYFRLADSKIAGADGWRYQVERCVSELGEDPASFFQRPAVAVAPARAITAAAVRAHAQDGESLDRDGGQGDSDMALRRRPARSRSDVAAAEIVEPALLEGLDSRDVAESVAPGSPARFRLRAVRLVVSEYRDCMFEGIARERTRTMWALFATGTVVLGLTLLARWSGVGEHEIGGAAVLFLVGALVGLFSGLAGRKDPTSQIEDYGLSTWRLLQTVVLSGVAAVLGIAVVVYGVAAAANSSVFPEASRDAASGQAATNAPTPAGGATPTPAPGGNTGGGVDGTANGQPRGEGVSTPQLRDLFDLERYPYGLLLAAVFGLAPARLLGRLETAANELKLNIARAEAG